MRKWRIEDSAELYNINNWGVNYFSINDKGNVVVTPREGCASVDLRELVDELQLRDVSVPMLIRFPDIIDTRIETINSCFKSYNSFSLFLTSSSKISICFFALK